MGCSLKTYQFNLRSPSKYYLTFWTQKVAHSYKKYKVVGGGGGVGRGGSRRLDAGQVAASPLPIQEEVWLLFIQICNRKNT